MECYEAQPLSLLYYYCENVLDELWMALRIVVSFGHFSGWMNCFDSMIWLLRFCWGYRTAIRELSWTILNAFLWIASNLASFEGTIIDGINRAYSIINRIRVLNVVMTSFCLAPQPLPLILLRVFIQRLTLYIMLSTCLLSLSPGSSVIPRRLIKSH